ncbi:MAG: helix-turn-helix domain-containing protein [Alphaproteobacteria bacterium]
MADHPDPIDVHVGQRVRLRRTLMGLSQVNLAGRLGLTFQQVQKYEKGYNRIGSSRLYQIARILDVSVAYFFEDIPVASDQPAARAAESAAPYEGDPMAKRETLELVRAYYRITDPVLRRRLFDLVKSIARAEGTSPTADG